MSKLKYSYMAGGSARFIKVNNFDEWYDKDFTRDYYYLDLDKKYRYIAAAGFQGIELFWFDIPTLQAKFGKLENFTEFLNERGIEKVTGCFCINLGAADKRKHENIYKSQQKVIDGLAALGANNLVIMPENQYYGTGPLDAEGLQNAADCMNEVGRRAADKGLDVSIHNEFWCAVNLYDHEKFIELTDPKYVKYCLDTAQLSIMGVDIVKFYDKWHERIKYFHLKDTNKMAAPDEERFGPGAEYDEHGKRWFYELGGGYVDFPSLFRLMKKYGHTSGWLTVEADGTPDTLATMLLAKNYLDTVLEPIMDEE